MNETIESYINIARGIIDGQPPSDQIYHRLALTEDQNLFALMAGADLIRDAFFSRRVHLCAICNGKSGRCSEDCRFCAQSKFHTPDIERYPLISRAALQKGAYALMDTEVDRYAIVTTGKGLATDEVRQVGDALAGLPSQGLSYCVSLGILGDAELAYLKACGVSRYHHNLETCRSHFDAVCTSHTYDDRVDTIRRARQAGLSVCSGGIFGVGESMTQVLELAFELRALEVDAVPINFLTPIPGTALEGADHLTPAVCLKIISIMRYVLPDREIIVCGGRMDNLKALHPLVFQAGANGIMTGNYLTTQGNQHGDDLAMIRQLGFEPGDRCRKPGIRS